MNVIFSKYDSCFESKIDIIKYICKNTREIYGWDFWSTQDMPDEYLCWRPFFSLLTVLGACKSKLNLNTSLHMTSVGFQDTQAQYPPSEFLHLLDYCHWFLPWRKLVRSASGACRFWVLCVSDLNFLNGNQAFSCPSCIFPGVIVKSLGWEVWFLWMCVDWLGQKRALFGLWVGLRIPL